MSKRARKLLREALPDLTWWRGVDRRGETVSGIVGAVLVIPQAITFAYLVGVAPAYGLYCAVFVAFLSSLFGNSPMVGGPNTAMSLLLAASVMPYAGRGSPLYIEYVLMLSIMVGLIQLLLWLLRGAELFRHLSPAAISAVKMGVGVLLIASGLEGALGLPTLENQFFYERFWIAAAGWRDSVNGYSAAISALTIASALLLRKRWPRAYILLAVAIGATLGTLIEAAVGPIASQVELLGRIALEPFPLTVPSLASKHLLVMQEVLPSAIAIAVLGLSQSLVIVRDLQSQLGKPINLHKEVLAQGLSNAIGPLFSAFAGAGSFNRTSVALQMGARTPLSGLIAAVAVLIIAWLLGPFLVHMPMPAIAAVLVLVGMGMIQPTEVRALMRLPLEAGVFWLTLFTVTFIGLEVGILVAALASIVGFVSGASKISFTVHHDHNGEQIQVRGNLYYGSLDALATHLQAQPATRTTLDLTRVSHIDHAARALLQSIQQQRPPHGGHLTILH